MPRFRAFFVNLSVLRKLIIVLWLFVVIVIALLLLSYEIIGSLSALRAYVEGEGLWSKAQKQAVHNLVRYAPPHSHHNSPNYHHPLPPPFRPTQPLPTLQQPPPA